MSNNNSHVINERYQISGRIGRGGMADVFLARDLLLDRDVAVKVLFPEHAIDPNFVERFRREAQSVAGLNHPNIVGVYDWGQTGNTYFMAMEYVKGRTLSDALRRQGRMTSPSAAGVGAAIANALAYAHRNNVVHRDIKPANILLGEDGAIKVVDFGIARALDAGHEGGLTQDGAVMGTATYFSPEQAKGEALDLRSDLYSLGVVLYELVSGKPPFAGDSALATAYKQVNEAAPRLRDLVPDVPLALEAIIAKCLTKNADMRYNNAEQLRDDLRRFMNGEPTLAVDEARVRSGKAPLGNTNLDQATTIMSPVEGSSSTTQILPRTSVMPATMGPVETLPEYDDERPSKRSYVVGAAVAGIVILGGIIFLITSLGGSSGVAVPNVKGVTCDVAKLKLEEAKFTVALNPANTVCDATNIVSSQVPASGELAKTGEAITLVFPVAQIDVPALLGLTAEAAQAAVEGAGFVFAKGPDVIDKTYALGQVAVQTPGGMTKLAKGQTVTVNVSGGSGQLAVPNIVIGQTTEAAQTFLAADPYKFVVTVTPEPSATIAKGLVTRTSPAQGTLVDSASAITIFVSSGPAPVAMPNVKGQTESAARDALNKLGLASSVEYVDLAAGNANVGKVIAQDTPAASMVNPGAAVVLTVGRDSSAPAG